jgi:hypothetical protein
MVTSLPEHLVETATRICLALEWEAQRYAPADELPSIQLNDAVFERVTDPANGLTGYQGIWRDADNQKRGSLVINSDGSYFAEYDVLRTHPDKPSWFVEAVTAWGRDGNVKTEPRLLAAV